jgi:hypothetical protein
MEVLLESLDRLEEKLQGETPMAPALWDQTDKSYRTYAVGQGYSEMEA